MMGELSSFYCCPSVTPSFDVDLAVQEVHATTVTDNRPLTQTMLSSSLINSDINLLSFRYANVLWGDPSPPIRYSCTNFGARDESLLKNCTSASYHVNYSYWLLNKDNNFLLSNGIKTYPHVVNFAGKYAVSLSAACSGTASQGLQ